MTTQSFLTTKTLSVCKVIREKALSGYYSAVKNFGIQNDPLVTIQGFGLKDFSGGVVLQQFFATANQINGMTAHGELATLFYVALLAPAGDIIEIGSWLGKSTVFLAQACKAKNSGKVYAVDTFKGNPGKEDWYTAPLTENESILGKFKKNLQLMQVQKWVQVCAYSSQEASKKLKIRQAAVIFIDGCHEYEPVTADISLWKNRIKSGGYLVFHDYHPNFPGVVTAVKETLSKDSTFRPLALFDTLLVFQKK